jgi:flavin reductase (DIM6/NTAB) family NADH-FMN oxidoreductase RutF
MGIEQKKWRCTVCGYIHEGPTPPDSCPICGVGPEAFELVVDDSIRRAMFSLTYGLFVVTSQKGELINGQCANTVFQITSQPPQLAIGIGTDRYTHEFIQESKVFAACVLAEDSIDLVRKFGFRSGREIDKFRAVDYTISDLGLPLLNRALATLQCRVVGQLECGTHTLFLGEVVEGEVLRDATPLTYAEYRRRK